jgi:hypothetical protein
MALYKYDAWLHKANATVEEFDKLYSPGAIVAWSGIYRCHACGHEVVHTVDKPLPPQNHHVHKPGIGAIQWRLVVTDYTQSS